MDSLKKQIEKNLRDFIVHAGKKYHLKKINPLLHKSLQEYCLRKGKRIRPLLFILSYTGYNSCDKTIHPSIFSISTAIELLHAFMLIHDDIIDRSDLRRGKPTMHRLLKDTVKTKEQDKLGNDLGIIAGDIIYAFSLNAFLNVKADPVKKEKALKYFIETTATTAIGEFIDTLHGVENLSKIKEKDVYLNYSYKTSRYTFMAPLILGAILAGAKDIEIKKLSNFGLLIGQAFQIQDDIIGIFGDEKTIGKSILSDFSESKKTLLVCRTIEVLLPKQKRSFTKIFSKPKKTFKDLVEVRKIFVEAGSLLYCLRHIERRLNKAADIFKALKINDTVSDRIKDSLSGLFEPSANIAREYKTTIF